MSPPVALKKAARTAGETARARLISVKGPRRAPAVREAVSRQPSEQGSRRSEKRRAATIVNCVVVRIHLSPPVYLENCIESKFAEKKRRNIKSNESKRVESI